LRRLFTGVPVVVLVTGLGGGTGSGAAATVAGFAAETGATVLAFATMPFSHEGERRMRQANEAAVKIGQKCHGLVVVHNDLLLQQVAPDAPLSESFAAADAWVGGALRGLASAFAPGALIAVDPSSLRSLLSTPGSPTLFAFGVGEGEGAAMKAARAAIECPLAHAPGAVAKVASLFVHVAGGPAMTSTEAFEAVAAVRTRFGGETSTILCARVEPALGDRIEVSVLGASLPAPKPPAKTKKGGKGEDPAQPIFEFATEESMRPRPVRRHAHDIHRRPGRRRAGVYPQGRAPAAGALKFASRLRPAPVLLRSALCPRSTSPPAARTSRSWDVPCAAVR
jgi:cell division protein FtsZ